MTIQQCPRDDCLLLLFACMNGQRQPTEKCLLGGKHGRKFVKYVSKISIGIGVTLRVNPLLPYIYTQNIQCNA